MAEKLVNLGNPNEKGFRQAELGSENIQIGRVPEPPFWRDGPQQGYHSNRNWFMRFLSGPNVRKVFIFKSQPLEGSMVDLDLCLAVHDEFDLAI